MTPLQQQSLPSLCGGHRGRDDQAHRRDHRREAHRAARRQRRMERWWAYRRALAQRAIVFPALSQVLLPGGRLVVRMRRDQAPTEEAEERVWRDRLDLAADLSMVILAIWVIARVMS
ncbi:MAG: hypothetical protein VYE81_05915 [Planctomycetota bacterium]|nr:hypothetical protein [Planctomycetota bacterium]